MPPTQFISRIAKPATRGAPEGRATIATGGQLGQGVLALPERRRIAGRAPTSQPGAGHIRAVRDLDVAVLVVDQ